METILFLILYLIFCINDALGYLLMWVLFILDIYVTKKYRDDDTKWELFLRYTSLIMFMLLLPACIWIIFNAY